MIYYRACPRCAGDVTHDRVYRDELYCLHCGKRWYPKLAREGRERHIDFDYYAKLAASDRYTEWEGLDDNDD